MLTGTGGKSAAGEVIAMTTDGGAHSPEYWARVTTAQLMRAPENDPFRLKLIAILTKHHTIVQERERSHLIQFGEARLKAPFSTEETIASLNEAVAEILAAAFATIYRGHFELDHVQLHLKRIVGKDFANIMNIERLWHAERQKNKKD